MLVGELAPQALDFEAHDTLYATHGLHAFAAKCPPPLASWAIDRYSEPGDLVVDPMAGSGTTLVEAMLAGRSAIGADIDPLARLIAKVKATPIPTDDIDEASRRLLEQTACWPEQPEYSPDELPAIPNLDRWFAPPVIADLVALRRTIAELDVSEAIREFFWVAFSSLITARTSIANARDLVHSRHHYRPHPTPPDVRAILRRRIAVMRRQVEEFTRLQAEAPAAASVRVLADDARRLSLADRIARLVFTSPPYCNALDYTRAHTFSVAWLADVLRTTTHDYVQLGRNYIGSERGALGRAGATPPDVPLVYELIEAVTARDQRRGRIVARYFADMAAVIAEAGRILLPGGVLVLVVCPSHIRKVEIPTHDAFVAIAAAQSGHGWSWSPLAVHERVLDDRRRLLPYMHEAFGRRMRTEYVVVLRRSDDR